MKKHTVPRILYYVFFIAAIIMVFVRIYLKSKGRVEEAQMLQWTTLGLLLAALICRVIERFFPKWFNNKPTREEIEKKVHGE